MGRSLASSAIPLCHDHPASAAQSGVLLTEKHTCTHTFPGHGMRVLAHTRS